MTKATITKFELHRTISILQSEIAGRDTVISNQEDTIRLLRSQLADERADSDIAFVPAPSQPGRKTDWHPWQKSAN